MLIIEYYLGGTSFSSGSYLFNANANPILGAACGLTVLICVRASSKDLNLTECLDKRYAITTETERLAPLAQCTRHILCRLLLLLFSL